MAVPPILRRFEAQIYKRRPGVPPALDAIVPAAARIDFHQQGVTVRTTVELEYTDPALIDPTNPNPPPATSVDVWHIGSVRPYDSLQYGLNASVTLTASVFGDTNPLSPRLYVWNTSVQSGLLLEAGQRLLRLTDRPIAFIDPTGTWGLGQPSYVDTDPTTGRGGCYLRPLRVDYVVSGTGVDTRLVTDAMGSYVMC